MATRSAVLGWAHDPTSSIEQPLFTVPAGYTYILKTITLFNGSSSNQTITLYYVPAGGPSITLYTTTTFGPATNVWFNIWWVFEPGDSLSFLVSGNKWDLYASGAALIGD